VWNTLTTHGPITGAGHDLDVMIGWVENINPCMVWLGYDSGKNKLPEPKLEKAESLHWQLAKNGFVVILKTIRKAWCE
jgi:hypothetical protein